MKKTYTPKTASEFMDELMSDPDYISRLIDKERKNQLQEEVLAREEKPLVDDLREAGFDVDSVYDLVNTRQSYSGAIHVLMTHLSRPYSRRIKEGIIRALTVREARGVAAGLLLDEYEKMDDTTTFGPKWAIGNALTVVLDEASLPRALKVVQDRRHGMSRSMFPRALSRFNTDEVREVLTSLCDDEDLSVEAAKALKRLSSKKKM